MLHNDSEFLRPLYLATTLSPLLLLKKNKYFNFTNDRNAMYTFSDVCSTSHAFVFHSHLMFQWLILPRQSREIGKLAVEAKLWDLILTLASNGGMTLEKDLASFLSFSNRVENHSTVVPPENPMSIFTERTWGNELMKVRRSQHKRHYASSRIEDFVWKSDNTSNLRMPGFVKNLIEPPIGKTNHSSFVL